MRAALPALLLSGQLHRGNGHNPLPAWHPQGSGIRVTAWAQLACGKVMITPVPQPFAHGFLLRVQRLS